MTWFTVGLVIDIDEFGDGNYRDNRVGKESGLKGLRIERLKKHDPGLRGMDCTVITYDQYDSCGVLPGPVKSVNALPANSAYSKPPS